MFFVPKNHYERKEHEYHPYSEKIEEENKILKKAEKCKELLIKKNESIQKFYSKEHSYEIKQISDFLYSSKKEVEKLKKMKEKSNVNKNSQISEFIDRFKKTFHMHSKCC